MELLKWYSIIFISIVMIMMISKVYQKMENKEAYKCDLIGFLMLIPVLSYIIGA